MFEISTISVVILLNCLIIQKKLFQFYQVFYSIFRSCYFISIGQILDCFKIRFSFFNYPPEKQEVEKEKYIYSKCYTDFI